MKKILGLGILLLAVIAVVIFTNVDWQQFQRAKAPDYDWQTVNLFYGGEKARFLKNPDITKQLERYKIRLNAYKAGSIEMVTSLPTADKDCLWPSNQLGVELAKQNGKTVLADSNIFNSAMVFYAWKPVTDALQKVGIVKRVGAIYTVDTQKLIAFAQQKKRWQADLDLNIYGPVKIFSTDPRKSNSGNMWAGLLANMLNDGQVVNANDLNTVLPDVQAYFQAMGYMEDSSGDIFENFLKQGMGARPIIVGYENQLIEFLLENKRYKQTIESKIDILYPTPTVFASHPLISLTPNCQRLQEALQDPKLQHIAWRDHGFRSGLIGVDNKPADLGLDNMPDTVTQVMPLPNANVMQRIIQSLD
ncbi:MAG: hypothetical protein ACWA5U_04555 [bacterium]